MDDHPDVAVPEFQRITAGAIDQPMTKAQVRFVVLTLLTIMLVVAVRLFLLGSLQREVYGDIQIVHEYVHTILAGEWPVRFNLSAGPLYHYLIAPIVLVAGLNYFGLKLASVIVSFGVLLATFALSRRLIDDTFALLATAIAGVSSWLLIFSRLGNSQILVPLLSTAALWLVLRYIQQGRRIDLVASAVVSALGLYAYPPSFILPGVIFATYFCLRLTGHRVAWADLGRFALVTILCALPFVWLVSLDPANFVSGYIGSKIVAEESVPRALFTNMLHALLAFHVRGDEIFRSNPYDLPHLDLVSGALFLVGVVYWLMPARRRMSPVLFVPFLLLQVPSMLVLAHEREVPSASRTLAVAPLAYILVASGLWWLVQLIKQRGWRRIASGVAAVALAAIVLLNLQRYFGDYMNGLPYHNTPIGWYVGTFGDSLPADTQLYIVGCCWEDTMPEPPYVRLMTARPAHVQTLEPDELNCDRLQFLKQPAVVVWSFHVPLPAPSLVACRQWLPAQLYMSQGGLPVFNAAPLRLDMPIDSTAGIYPVESAGAQLLDYDSASVNGTTIGVRHSSLDIGSVGEMFDGDRETLARGNDANPMVIELRFPHPRPLNSIGLDLATMPHVKITVRVTAEDNTVTTTTKEFVDLPVDPHVDLPIQGGQHITVVRLDIEDKLPEPAEGYHIHVRELQLRP